MSLRDPVAVRLAVRAIGCRAIRHRIARYEAIFMPTNLIPYFQCVAVPLPTARRLGVKPADTVRFRDAVIYARTGRAFDRRCAAEIKLPDQENAYHHGIKQFIDDKTYKPTFSAYDRDKASRD